MTEENERYWRTVLGELSDDEQARWEEPMELLKVLTVKAQVYLRHINDRSERLYPDYSKSDPRPLACTRLFASVCRVSKEILALLKAGYPIGAFAHWRILHETSVVFQVLAQSPPEIARLYQEHGAIREYKRLRPFATSDTIDGLPFLKGFQAAYDDVKRRRDELIAEHGTSFKEDYGWSAPLFKAKTSRRHTFADLEKFVGLEQIRRIYGEASQYVHSSSSSIAWHEHPSDDEFLKRVVGPMTSGFAVPIVFTGMALVDALRLWIIINDPHNPFLPEDYGVRQAEELKDDISKLFEAVRAAETDESALMMLVLLLGSAKPNTT